MRRRHEEGRRLRLLSFLGGGSPLRPTPSRRSSRWRGDLVAHYRLVKLRVEDLGPLVVAIDSKGNSLFDQLQMAGSPRHDPARAPVDRNASQPR
jgi:fumarate hydratase subunit beta